jgi:hypothetical protein
MAGAKISELYCQTSQEVRKETCIQVCAPHGQGLIVLRRFIKGMSMLLLLFPYLTNKCGIQSLVVLRVSKAGTTARGRS